MGKVGLIVNPISGTDIRRVHSTVGFIDINQKARIIKNVLMGLEAVGINEVLMMPDFYGISNYAIGDLPQLNVKWSFIDMKPQGDYTDTINAMTIFLKESVGSVVILGGDGTIRAASLVPGSEHVPIIPLSTGTNNTIPYFVDGTIAGIVAGAIAMSMVKLDEVNTYRLKRIVLYVNNKSMGHALVELSTTMYPFRGARAIMDPNMLIETFIAYARPVSVGLASLAYIVRHTSVPKDSILHIKFGNKSRVKVILMPGYITNIGIDSYEELPLGKKVIIENAQTIEFDGEREVEIFKGDEAYVIADNNGPLIVNIDKVMEYVYLSNAF